MSLLQEREFQNITISDIVSGSGVSVGTFYAYFNSKVDVFYETCKDADHYFTKEAAPQLTQESAFDRMLFFQGIIRYGVKRDEFCTSMKPPQAADFCLIAARGLAYNWCTLDGEYDLVRAMREYMNELLKVFLIKP